MSLLTLLTDLVPYFNQRSYIRYRQMDDAYTEFDIEISFKPENAFGK